MTDAERTWALALIDMMCRADSNERLTMIGRKMMVDLNREPCYISATASEVVKSCGAILRKAMDEK